MTKPLDQMYVYVVSYVSANSEIYPNAYIETRTRFSLKEFKKLLATRRDTDGDSEYQIP